MNFFIFNSKIGQVILLFTLTLLSLFWLASLALSTYVQMKTGQTHFIEEIASKAKHMRLNYTDAHPDIVFVGNSHTAYHISKEILSDYGLDVYNFGVSGTKFFNNAHMVEEASYIKPKTIILSIPVQVIYEDQVYYALGMSFTDLKLIWTLPFTLQQKLRASFAYLESLNKIRIYAESIHAKVLNIYRRFDPSNGVFTGIEKKKSPNIESLVRCAIILKTPIESGLTSYTCSNGDLIMGGHAADIVKKREVLALENPNPQIIAFINQIGRKVEEQGGEFVLLIEPSSSKSYSFDLDELKNALNLPIIDLTYKEFPAEMWGNVGHLNYKGRAAYSHLLGETLTKMGQ